MSSLVELEIKAICFIVQCILVLKHGIECMKKAVIILYIYIYICICLVDSLLCSCELLSTCFCCSFFLHIAKGK